MILKARQLAFIATAIVLAPTTLTAQSVAADYKAKCALCHGEDGSGSTPSGKALKAKDLRAPDIQAKPDTELTDVITKGRNKMPAFGQKLTPEQVKQFVAYIHTLAKK